MSGNNDSKPQRPYLSDSERQARIYGSYEHVRNVGDYEISYTVPHTARYEPAATWRGGAGTQRSRRGRAQHRGAYGGHNYFPSMRIDRETPVVNPVQGALYAFDVDNTPAPASSLMDPHPVAFPSTTPTAAGDRDMKIDYDSRSGPINTSMGLSQPARDSDPDTTARLAIRITASSSSPASNPFKEEGSSTTIRARTPLATTAAKASPSCPSPSSSSGFTIRIPPANYKGKGKEHANSVIHVRRPKKEDDEGDSE